MIPNLDLAAIREYCEQRVPKEARDQVRIEHPVARLRYPAKSGHWTLYWHDSNERWHRYQTGPTANIRSLLDEIDHDPTDIFWG